VSRRRTSFGLRCWQIAGVGALLYGTAILLHAAIAWLYGMAR
jgi:hypothetical protein